MHKHILKIGKFSRSDTTFEIPYGYYIIKIRYNFKNNQIGDFEAYMESGLDLSEDICDVIRKQHYIDTIKQCLDTIGLKCSCPKLEIKEEYNSFTKATYKKCHQKAVCYIKINDLMNWLTLQKMKGEI